MKKILEEGKTTFYQQILKSGTIVVIREDKEPLPKKWTESHQDKLAKEERKLNKEEIKNGKNKKK